MTTHATDCDMDEDCTCGALDGACVFCAGSGEAFDPTTGEGPQWPACGGSGQAATP